AVDKNEFEPNLSICGLILRICGRKEDRLLIERKFEKGHGAFQSLLFSTFSTSGHLRIYVGMLLMSSPLVPRVSGMFCSFGLMVDILRLKICSTFVRMIFVNMTRPTKVSELCFQVYAYKVISIK
ncbi:protein kinase superfamily protein, partial [Striga asiatica]